MITNTTSKTTYTVIDGVDTYAVGFEYNTNPDNTPQIKVYCNKLSNTPLVYGVDYTLSADGLNVVLTNPVAGDRLDIIRNIPMVQLSDYVIGRIDPEQIENDFDEAVMRDQQMQSELDLAIEIPEDHEARIQEAEQDIDNLESLVPTQATSQNQLADKDFVNSSIATSTATFRGTYNSLAELEAVTADENDYGFVVATDAVGNTEYNRYKYTGSAWVFEFTLNNSSFTADQWAAINSGVTQGVVTKVNNLPVLIKNVSVDSSTGAISFVPTVTPTTVTVKNLFGGSTISGTTSVSSGIVTFTPTTPADILSGEWTLEVQ